MLKQIKILTGVSLCNYFGINEIKHTHDKKKKNRLLGMIVAWVLVIVMFIYYVAALSYGYIKIGIGDIIPMYLITITSIVILFFTIFKAGSVIFQVKSYQMLCSLPIKQSAIVVSRFITMYVTNVLLSLVVMVPGMAVYGYFIHPGTLFYIYGIVGTLFIPFLPIAIATILGAAVTAISSRMKHKSIVNALLSVILVGGVLYLSYGMPASMGGKDMSINMLKDFSVMIADAIGNIYPPAVWLGGAMVSGELSKIALYFAASIVVFIIMVVLVTANFQSICRSLNATYAMHNYQMGTLKANSALRALYKREFKHYFSSSIYLTNTIIGPFMMVGLAVALLIVGPQKINAFLPLSGGIITITPFLLAATACLMTTTCTSVSLEGKNLWLAKTLPVTSKMLLDSKILMNLLLYVPFYIITEVLLVVAFKPNILELVWLIVLPVVFALFACVFGISMNLLFPVFDWTDEVTVVKQGASSMAGGLGGSVMILLCAVPLIFNLPISADIIRLIECIVLLAVTAVLYKKNNKLDLRTLGE